MDVLQNLTTAGRQSSMETCNAPFNALIFAVAAMVVAAIFASVSNKTKLWIISYVVSVITLSGAIVTKIVGWEALAELLGLKILTQRNGVSTLLTLLLPAAFVYVWITQPPPQDLFDLAPYHIPYECVMENVENPTSPTPKSPERDLQLTRWKPEATNNVEEVDRPFPPPRCILDVWKQILGEDLSWPDAVWKVRPQRLLTWRPPPTEVKPARRARVFRSCNHLKLVIIDLRATLAESEGRVFGLTEKIEGLNDALQAAKVSNPAAEELRKKLDEEKARSLRRDKKIRTLNWKVFEASMARINTQEKLETVESDLVTAQDKIKDLQTQLAQRLICPLLAATTDNLAPTFPDVLADSRTKTPPLHLQDSSYEDISLSNDVAEPVLPTTPPLHLQDSSYEDISLSNDLAEPVLPTTPPLHLQDSSYEDISLSNDVAEPVLNPTDVFYPDDHIVATYQPTPPAGHGTPEVSTAESMFSTAPRVNNNGDVDTSSHKNKGIDTKMYTDDQMLAMALDRSLRDWRSGGGAPADVDPAALLSPNQTEDIVTTSADPEPTPLSPLDDTQDVPPTNGPEQDTSDSTIPTDLVQSRESNGSPQAEGDPLLDLLPENDTRNTSSPDGNTKDISDPVPSELVQSRESNGLPQAEGDPSLDLLPENETRNTSSPDGNTKDVSDPVPSELVQSRESDESRQSEGEPLDLLPVDSPQPRDNTVGVLPIFNFAPQQSSTRALDVFQFQPPTQPLFTAPTGPFNFQIEQQPSTEPFRFQSSPETSSAGPIGSSRCPPQQQPLTDQSIDPAEPEEELTRGEILRRLVKIAAEREASAANASAATFQPPAPTPVDTSQPAAHRPDPEPMDMTPGDVAPTPVGTSQPASHQPDPEPMDMTPGDVAPTPVGTSQPAAHQPDPEPMDMTPGDVPTRLDPTNPLQQNSDPPMSLEEIDALEFPDLGPMPEFDPSTLPPMSQEQIAALQFPTLAPFPEYDPSTLPPMSQEEIAALQLPTLAPFPEFDPTICPELTGKDWSSFQSSSSSPDSSLPPQQPLFTAFEHLTQLPNIPTIPTESTPSIDPSSRPKATPRKRNPKLSSILPSIKEYNDANAAVPDEQAMKPYPEESIEFSIDPNLRPKANLRKRNPRLNALLPSLRQHNDTNAATPRSQQTDDDGWVSNVRKVQGSLSNFDSPLPPTNPGAGSSPYSWPPQPSRAPANEPKPSQGPTVGNEAADLEAAIRKRFSRSSYPLDVRDPDYQQLVDLMSNFSETHRKAMIAEAIKIAREEDEDLKLEDDDIRIVTQENFVEAIARVRQKNGIPGGDQDDSDSDSDSDDSIIESSNAEMWSTITRQGPGSSNDFLPPEDPEVKQRRLGMLRTWQLMTPNFRRAQGIDWNKVMRATWCFNEADGMKVVYLASEMAKKDNRPEISEDDFLKAADIWRPRRFKEDVFTGKPK